MADLVRTIPLPNAVDGDPALSEPDTDDENEKLEFGFKWDATSDEESEQESDSDSEGLLSGAEDDGDDIGSGGDGSADGDASDDDSEDIEEGSDAESAGSDDVDEEKEADAVEGPSESDAEEEPSKIPRYKPGTKEKVPEFSELHLSRPLLRAVKEIGYEIPTTIQVGWLFGCYLMSGVQLVIVCCECHSGRLFL